MTIAVSIVLSVYLAIFLTAMGSIPQERITDVVIDNTLKLEELKKEEVIPPVPVIPPPELAKLRTVDFVAFVIKPDNEVYPDEMPPTQDDIKHAVISNFKHDGLDADNIVAPPAVLYKGTSLTVAPVLNDDVDTRVFVIVENVAEFPGGPDAWRRFLERYLEYPQQAIDNGTQAVVRVEFVVDREGFLSDIRALNNPGDGLAEEAIRIITKSQQWKPAEQNGRKVRYRHIQSITFRLE